MSLGGNFKWQTSVCVLSAILLSSCGGGGGNGNSPLPTDTNQTNASPRLFTDPEPEFLSTPEIERILAQAIAEAKARNAPATIAVVDRVGNVLAVYRMTGALGVTRVTDAPNGNSLGLQNQNVPSTLAAISKAVTGAYLSSAGNAFTSRTASMIIQEHFPPAPKLTVGLESGPLFGVQFSQLPCSDLNTRYDMVQGPFIGPNRSPLGLSADAGGIPLYQNGVLIGAIGVSSDDSYSFDSDVTDVDQSDEEAIALAGTVGFDAPMSIRANRIAVDGTSLRFTDETLDNLLSTPANAPAFIGLTLADGRLVPVRGYFGVGAPVIVPGTIYGSERSGIRRSTAFNTPDAYVLSDGFGVNRYAPRAGGEGGANALTQVEVNTLLEEAFGILSKARAQIRQPFDSRAQVSVSIVDTQGNILGIIRSPDAPIFGIDVSLQKARTATFFSGATAANEMLSAGRSPVVVAGGAMLPQPDIPSYVGRVRDLLDDPSALTGAFAFADRSGGNLSRPYFPDGEAPNGPGPLSVPIDNFNPFANGMQIDLVSDNILEHVTFVIGNAPMDTRQQCSRLPDVPGGTGNRMRNGMQIFPGSVPIYRGNVLIGGIGVSGDGIDQDDMISFLGLHNAGVKLGTINNAPNEIRADRIIIKLNDREVRLRYVNCPFTPFIGSAEQNVCQGK